MILSCFQRYSLIIAVLLLTGSLLLCGGELFAQETLSVKIGLDVRFDAEVTKTEWDKEGAGNVNSLVEKFVLTSGRFNIYGKIDEATTYRIRYEMKGNHTEAGADNITSAINYFYIDHSFGDLYLRVGKQFIVTSSWEFQYNRSQVYHYSETFLRVPAFYETGAQIGYKFAGQTIGIQATNSIPESSEKKGRDFTKGFFWYGDISDKLLQPIVSYVVFPRSVSEVGGMRDSRVSTTVASLGTKLNLKPFDFDLYGGQVATPKFKSYEQDKTTGTANEVSHVEEVWSTVVAYARVKLEEPKLHPFTKISHDQGKVDGKDYFAFTRYSLGVEWFPTSDQYWLQAVYVGHDDKFLKIEDGGATLQSENTRKVSKYIVGVGSAF